MGRLFWTFPDGWPGAGLLLMRFALSSTVIARCLASWPAPSSLLLIACVAESLASVSLCIGLVTPVCALIVAAIELWRFYATTGDAMVHVLLATLALALALIGPGAFSVDACMFGWRRIDVPASKGSKDNSN